jgi:hypothetical protein
LFSAAFHIDRTQMRQLDVNSLLRLYDHARSTRAGPGLAIEKARAAIARDRLAAELRKRGVRI